MDVIYTRKQIVAINAAWDKVAYLASTTDWTMRTVLDNALKAERGMLKPGDVPLQALKAGLLLSFMDGARPTRPMPSLSDMYGMRQGRLAMMLIGARVAAQYADRLDTPLILAIQAALGTHDSAWREYLDRVSAPCRG